MTTAGPVSRYYCPLPDCGWTHDVPEPTLDDTRGITPEPGAATLREMTASIAFQTVLRHTQGVEAVLAEHMERHDFVEAVLALVAAQQERDAARTERDALASDLDVYRAEIRALQDKLEQVAYDRTWPPDRERPADVVREVGRATAAAEQHVQAVITQYKAARGRWDRERDRLTAEMARLRATLDGTEGGV